MSWTQARFVQMEREIVSLSLADHPLCCFFGQDASLSQWLDTIQVCDYILVLALILGVTCDGRRNPSRWFELLVIIKTPHFSDVVSLASITLIKLTLNIVENFIYKVKIFQIFTVDYLYHTLYIH